MFSNLGSASITAKMRAYQPPSEQPQKAADNQAAQPAAPKNDKPIKAD
jgi:hypothetical protein